MSGEVRFVYVGTYTKDRSEGIYAFRMDPDSGALSPTGDVTRIDNPSFLALDPQQRCLYAVNEAIETGGPDGGAVSAFSIAPETGRLTFLNQQPVHGLGPCHVSVEATGRFVLVANYGSGSVCMIPIEGEGRLGEATDIVQHEGSSVDTGRQSEPHAHSINPDPTNRYAFVADLGLDKVMIYDLDLDRGKLSVNKNRWAQLHGGAGPRHLAFSPDGSYAYVINEMDSTMTVFTYDSSQGRLDAVQTLSTLPEGYSDTSYCADVHVAPSGRFVYGSNRGHDSIVIFAVDVATGKLTPVAHESTCGEWPRNFAIDPSGRFLFAENERSDSIVTFRVDQTSGRLTPTDHVVNVGAPVCLKFMAV